MTTATLPRRPTKPEDLAAIIAETAAAGAQVQLIGSGSMPLARHDAARPIQPVSTTRMNALVEHAVADMTVIVHAGMTLDTLQRHLAWHNQWLPVDPPAVSGRNPMQRTLGGLIATNALGPLREGSGDWRFHILGTRWVDAAGNLIKGGGRTVKNVAGYSTPRMLIGSCGALGAIAEVTLRAAARPADEQCVVLYGPTDKHAENLLAATLTADVSPAYIQVIGSQGFQQNVLQLPAPPHGHQLVVIGFLGQPEVCAAQIERVRALPAAAGLESIAQTAAQSGRLRLWMTSEPAGAAGFRLHALSSQVTAAVAAIEQLAADAGTHAFLVSEAAAGVIRGTFAAAPESAVAGLGDLAASLGATLVFTHGVPFARHASSIEAKIKAELDPHALFGPTPAIDPPTPAKL